MHVSGNGGDRRGTTGQNTTEKETGRRYNKQRDY
jgi:hypothetical protein